MAGIPGISDGPDVPEADAPSDRRAEDGSSGPSPGGAPPVLPPTRPEDGSSTFLVVKTSSCAWCQRALDFLQALHQQRGDFQVAVLDANEQPEAFRKITATTRRTTVPQVLLDGGFVGGWDDLAKAAKSGRLDAYLDGEDWKTAASRDIEGQGTAGRARRWWRGTR